MWTGAILRNATEPLCLLIGFTGGIFTLYFNHNNNQPGKLTNVQKYT